jgi:hypothetical protein
MSSKVTCFGHDVAEKSLNKFQVLRFTVSDYHSLSRFVIPATLESSVAGTTTLDRECLITSLVSSSFSCYVDHFFGCQFDCATKREIIQNGIRQDIAHTGACS